VRVPKCAVCKAEYVKRKPGQKVCSPKCALSLVAKNRQSKPLKVAKLARVARKLTRPDQVKKTQAAVNKYVRVRDEGKPCISCGTSLLKLGRRGGDYDAGHYRSVGSAPHLRFAVEEGNINGQCKRCNKWLVGNVVAYRQGLIMRIGLEAVEKLEADNDSRHYSLDQLQDIERDYKDKTKALEAERGGDGC
jgi:hypothetical protein